MISSNSLGLLFKIKGDSSDGRKAVSEFREQVKKDLSSVENNVESLDSANDKLSKSFDTVGGSAGKASGAMASFIGNLAADAAARFADVLISGAKTLIDYSSRLEQTKVGFESLLGSGEKASKLLKEIQTFAKDTPFEFAGIASLSQRLLGANIEAEKIIPLMRDIGNVVAATGETSQERLEGITVALTQVISKQKLSAEEAEQFAERGVNAYDLIAKATGKTQTEVRKLGEDGRLSAETLLQSLQKVSRENFGDAMEKQSKTFAGAMSNIKDSLLIVATTAFEPLYERIKTLAVRFAADIQSQGSDFEKVGDVIAKNIGRGLGEAIPSIVESFGKMLANSLKKTFTGEWEGFGFYGVSLVKGFYESFEKAYDDIGKRLANKLGIKTSAERNTNFQSQPYLTQNELETRLPGANTSLAPGESPVLIPIGSGDAKKKATKSAAEIFDEGFREFAKDNGFTVSRTKGGAINSGSKHPLGLAGDLSIRGKSVDEIVSVLAAGIEKGYRVIDERFIGAIPGIKSTGPNAHFESPGSKKSSLFIDDRPDLYGGQAGLNYLKKLDEDRRNKKTASDEIAEFAKKEVEDKKKANEETVKNREQADRRVLQNAKNTADEEKAINENLLAQKKITQDEFDKRNEQAAIDLLTKEKNLLDERLILAQSLGVDTVEIEQEIADKVSQIKVKQSEAETAAYLKSKKYLEDLKQLRLETAQAEQDLFDAKVAASRQDLQRVVDNTRGQTRLDAVIELRDFELGENERRAKVAIERAEEDKKNALEAIEDKEKEKEKVEEINKAYKNRLETIKQLKEIEDGATNDQFNPQINDARDNADPFSAFAAGIGAYLENVALIRDANGQLQFSFEQVFSTMKDLGLQAFGALAQGFGQMVAGWVLGSDKGSNSLRKLAANVLAQVASMATTYALMSLAAAALATTVWGAAILGGTPAQFLKAAALFGAVAIGTAIAGRAVAGDSFKQENSGAYGSAQGGNEQGSNRSYTGGPWNPYGDKVFDVGGGAINMPEQKVNVTLTVNDKSNWLGQAILVELDRNSDFRTRMQNQMAT